MKKNIYAEGNSEYLEKNNTWHEEDSPWKAKQILKLIDRNKIMPKSIAEIGCGFGEILRVMQEKLQDKTIVFEGYDIAPDAIKAAKTRENDKLNFFEEDLIAKKDAHFDLLLVIDVFEHVDNYIGFIDKCGAIADYKMYHIPLQLNVSGILRGTLMSSRKSVGHIHYFSKDTALATLTDCGQKIIDYFYTKSAIENTKSTRTKFANLLRVPFYKLNPDLAVRLFGGYSLIVLTK